jgi:hypothetical protein
MEMLVGEQKQDGVALLLDPAGRRSLISPFRISRKCRMCVKREAAFSSHLTLACRAMRQWLHWNDRLRSDARCEWQLALGADRVPLALTACCG